MSGRIHTLDTIGVEQVRPVPVNLPRFRSYTEAKERLISILGRHGHRQDYPSRQLQMWGNEILGQRTVGAAWTKIDELGDKLLVNPYDGSRLEKPVRDREWIWEERDLKDYKTLLQTNYAPYDGILIEAEDYELGKELLNWEKCLPLRSVAVPAERPLPQQLLKDMPPEERIEVYLNVSARLKVKRVFEEAQLDMLEMSADARAVVEGALAVAPQVAAIEAVYREAQSATERTVEDLRSGLSQTVQRLDQAETGLAEARSQLDETRRLQEESDRIARDASERLRDVQEARAAMAEATQRQVAAAEARIVGEQSAARQEMARMDRQHRETHEVLVGQAQSLQQRASGLEQTVGELRRALTNAHQRISAQQQQIGSMSCQIANMSDEGDSCVIS